MKINVLLADGRKIFREGLCALLEKHADLAVVGEADEPATAARLLKAVPARIVVLTTSSPGRSAAEGVRSLIAVKPNVRVIVLAMHHDATFIRDILEAGAAGCLTKDCASEELVRAIHTVVSQKQVYLSPAMTEAVVSGYVLPGRQEKTPRRLAPRELEILQRIAEGQTTKEIALSLGVGTKTVETHRRRIMEKLNKHSIAELTKYAIREGLTSLEPQV